MSKIILDTDPEAAELVTVTLWKSSKGNLYSREDAARYDGCTHRACEVCGEPALKHYLLCDECRDDKDIEKYESREKISWDYETPIYSETHDKYIIDSNDLNDLLEELDTPLIDLACGCVASTLRLRSCKPIYLSQIQEDYWSDDLAEDQDLPKEILAALEVLNDSISSHKPVSWMPGKYAVTL